jgi:hypothetical protein
VFDDLGYQERVKGRLIIPDLRVHVMPFQAKSGFRQLETFIRANLNGRQQRDEALDSEKSRQEQSKNNDPLGAPPWRSRSKTLRLASAASTLPQL